MPVLEPSLGLLAGLFVLAAVVLQAGFFRVACFFLFTCILTVALGFAATYAVALRQPTSAPSLPRKLKFATPAAFESLKLRYQWECELPITRNALLSSLPEAVNARIDRFLSLILQHYIIAWFKPLTSTRAPRAFPRAVEDTIRFSITALLTRATTLDWPTILVSEVLPQVTSHVSHFKEAGGVTATSQDAEADIIMSKKYASLLPGGKLHPAVDVASSNTRPAEERYLRQVFSRILPILLPHEESTSSAVAVIVREVLASTVCVPLVDTLSEPDFWNQMIENKVSTLKTSET